MSDRNNRKAAFALALGLTVALAPAAVMAQGPNDPLHMSTAARKAHMKLLKWNISKLGGMAKGAIPYDAEKAAAAAADLKAVAHLDMRDAWPEGSDSASYEKSRALPKIWENMEDFGKKFMDMQAAADAMAEAAGQGPDAMKAALGNLGGTCKACHKEYRKPKDG